MPVMPATLKEAVLEHRRRDPGRLYARCLMPDGAVAPVTYGDLVARGSQFAAGFEALGARRGDRLLDQTLFERGRRAAGFLDVLKLRPRRGAKLLRQVFDPARARARRGCPT